MNSEMTIRACYKSILEYKPSKSHENNLELLGNFLFLVI